MHRLAHAAVATILGIALTAARSGAQPAPASDSTGAPAAARAQPAPSLRAGLAALGIAPSLSVPLDWSRGGDGSTGAALRALASVGIALDLERLAGWRGTTAFVQYQHFLGRPASPRLGDLQGFSNIEAQGLGRLGELWIEHRTADGRLRVKAGNVDANAEFARTDHGALFLNSAMGYSPSIFSLPTFPDPATSVGVFVDPAGPLRLSLAIFDGDEPSQSSRRVLGAGRLVNRPRAHFAIGEAELAWTRGRVAAGGWRHSGRFARLDGAGAREGTGGGYLVLDQSLLGSGDGERLGAYVQWARADRAVAELAEHLGAGLVLATRRRGDARDALGLAASLVRGAPACANGARGGEVALEATYDLRARPWLAVRPDLQVIRPVGAASHRAVVGTLRVVLDF